MMPAGFVLRGNFGGVDAVVSQTGYYFVHPLFSRCR